MLAACGRYTAKRLSVAPKFQVFGAHRFVAYRSSHYCFFCFCFLKRKSVLYDCLATKEESRIFGCRRLETGRPELQCSGLFLAQQCSTARLCLHPSLALSCLRVSEIVMSEMSSSSNGARFLSLPDLLLAAAIVGHECWAAV